MHPSNAKQREAARSGEGASADSSNSTEILHARIEDSDSRSFTKRKEIFMVRCPRCSLGITEILVVKLPLQKCMYMHV